MLGYAWAVLLRGGEKGDEEEGMCCVSSVRDDGEEKG